MEPTILTQEPLSLDYFSGGVPTGSYFSFKLTELRGISQSKPSKKHLPTLGSLQEICFIGLMSYFEAFCKDHFASILNLEPSLLHNLKKAGQNVDLDATRIWLFRESVASRLGFLVSEKYDFGSAQKVNALFGALLKVTPFGKADAGTYAELLNDRNLLVHHGGTFTLAYLEQKGIDATDLMSNAFFNSHVTRKSDVLTAITFIEGIARKIVRSTHKALVAHLTEHSIRYSVNRQGALDYIGWYDKEDFPQENSVEDPIE